MSSWSDMNSEGRKGGKGEKGGSMGSSRGMGAMNRVGGMRAPTEAVLGAFCDHFNLNQDARNKLRELTPELQTIAVEQFDPPASADNNGKFILYARSLQQASQQGKLERFKGPSG